MRTTAARAIGPGGAETASAEGRRWNGRAPLARACAALPHLLESAEGERGVVDVVNISSVVGRVVRTGNSVYAATKHAVGAFSESLRQEVTERHVRVALVEPGMVSTELTEDAGGCSDSSLSEIEWLHAEDVAEAVNHVVTRPRRASVNEILVRPTEQVR